MDWLWPDKDVGGVMLPVVTTNDASESAGAPESTSDSENAAKQEAKKRGSLIDSLIDTVVQVVRGIDESVSKVVRDIDQSVDEDVLQLKKQPGSASMPPRRVRAARRGRMISRAPQLEQEVLLGSARAETRRPRRTAQHRYRTMPCASCKRLRARPARES
jgi:hypothetical protein